MDDSLFLKRIFEGYVNCYRMNNWHTSSTYSDMTQLELNFFSQLGQQLGYYSRREFGQRTCGHKMDLCWIDRDRKNKLILWLERENKNWRGPATIKKLLSKNSLGPEYLVGVFGWLTEENLESIKREISSDLGQSKLLVIAYIGPNPDNAKKVDGMVFCDGKYWKRAAKSELDEGGYFYIYFKDSEWEPFTIP